MTQSSRLAWLSGVVACAVLLAGCGAPPAKASKESPAKVEKMAEGLNRLSVTEKAAQRLGIETARVQARTVDGQQRTTIPYGAIIYDKDGAIWAYAVQEPRVFVRQKVSVDAIDGPTVVLTSGPGIGTEVVSVGAAELYGLEFGIGK